jgi:hypothetical protein
MSQLEGSVAGDDHDQVGDAGRTRAFSFVVVGILSEEQEKIVVSAVFFADKSSPLMAGARFN